ncbi:MAG: hypothetical protein OCC49_04445 [Fibrobacterales bacterium]
MRINTIIKSVITIAVLGATMAVASTTELVDQTRCPVMGGVINESIYSEYKDQRVYHCCGMCKTDFAKDPEKYLLILNESGQKAFDLAADREDNDE